MHVCYSQPQNTSNIDKKRVRKHHPLLIPANEGDGWRRRTTSQQSISVQMAGNSGGTQKTTAKWGLRNELCRQNDWIACGLGRRKDFSNQLSRNFRRRSNDFTQQTYLFYLKAFRLVIFVFFCWKPNWLFAQDSTVTHRSLFSYYSMFYRLFTHHYYMHIILEISGTRVELQLKSWVQVQIQAIKPNHSI